MNHKNIKQLVRINVWREIDLDLAMLILRLVSNSYFLKISMSEVYEQVSALIVIMRLSAYS